MEDLKHIWHDHINMWSLGGVLALAIANFWLWWFTFVEFIWWYIPVPLLAFVVAYYSFAYAFVPIKDDMTGMWFVCINSLIATAGLLLGIVPGVYFMITYGHSIWLQSGYPNASTKKIWQLSKLSADKGLGLYLLYISGMVIGIGVVFLVTSFPALVNAKLTILGWVLSTAGSAIVMAYLTHAEQGEWVDLARLERKSDRIRRERQRHFK